MATSSAGALLRAFAEELQRRVMSAVAGTARAKFLRPSAGGALALAAAACAGDRQPQGGREGLGAAARSVEATPPPPSATPSAVAAASVTSVQSAPNAPAAASPLRFPIVRGAVRLSAPVGPAATLLPPPRFDGGELPAPATNVTKRHTLTWSIPAGAETIIAPPCAGATALGFDGATTLAKAPPGEFLTEPRALAVPRGAAALRIDLDIGGYESRVACGFSASVGVVDHGVATLTFSSAGPADRGAGRAFVYLPRAIAQGAPGPVPVLVSPHPWGGDAATYLRYAELLDAAEAAGVVVLFPSGLGNSLYTAPAEREVLTALDALAAVLPVDGRRVGLFGASMGGAGATTIGFHNPDRFSVVASLFGDSRYDRRTYVKSLLRSDAEARAVNADDVAENGLHLKTILVHGTADKVSDPVQTTLFCEHLRRLQYDVSCTLLPGRGHEGRVVAEQIAPIVAAVASTRAPERPSHVRFRAVRAVDDVAYGVRLVKVDGGKPAYVDVEGRDGKVYLHAAENLRSLGLAENALGLGTGSAAELPLVVDAGVPKLPLFRDTARR